MFLPKLAKISRAFSGVFSKGTIWNLIFGCKAWTLDQSSIRSCAGVIGDEPIRIILLSSCIAFLALVMESLQYCIMYFESWYRECPAFVKCSPLCVRSNSLTPNESSSKLICLITAVGVIKDSSAALLKLPASATLINVSSCGLYITFHLPYWNELSFLRKSIGLFAVLGIIQERPNFCIPSILLSSHSFWTRRSEMSHFCAASLTDI